MEKIDNIRKIRGDVSKTQRINIVGTSGSGKSTFAKALANQLNVPYIELDQLFWKPGWQKSSDEEFFSRIQTCLATDRWIVDGNYTRSIPIKWKNVQMVVWLDYPFATTLMRAIKRAFIRSITRTELWVGTGNRERFKESFFSKEGIVWWTISTHSQVRARYIQLMADPIYQHITFVRLRSQADANHFLKNFETISV